MSEKAEELPEEAGLGLPIFTVRGQRVILDADLARLYGVPTRVSNQAILRNRDRFPEDFAFRLTAAEMADVRPQSAVSGSQPIDGES